ncbi:DegV family protein [Risungbinella massiliensis]|uniref:DegV family protein n=1 Tax=Risungbinella massiliensis TaxID=1329796 RepID=UPI0005CC3452|nr:DegV family protein [Risungbinella massiliensis]
MTKVKIVTDSAADIPASLVEELNIQVIPMRVQLEGKTYTPGEDLTTEEFYRLLKSAKELPTTSQPSPMEIQLAYEQAIADGATHILAIHLSSAMSGTYQSAALAKSMIENPSAEIVVYDSRSASYGSGLIVVAAARAAKEGKSLEECLEIVEHYSKTQEIFVLVDTLEYLQKGGRIGKASAMVGSLLNIKPILGINREGEIYPRDKVRGRNKAQQKIFQLIREEIPAGPVSVGIIHSESPAEAEAFLESIRALDGYDIQDAVISEIGPVVGTHTGAGTVAAVLVPHTK